MFICVFLGLFFFLHNQINDDEVGKVKENTTAKNLGIFHF